jgi:AcrR family transcriptional regulator
VQGAGVDLSSNELLDLRVRRTYKFLWDALIELMTERDFGSITVTDICERAMVHRTTLYKHFEDKYGLLLHGIQGELNELFETVDKTMETSVERDEEADNRTTLTAVFEHVLKKEGFYRLMLTGDSFGQFSTLLRKSLAERLEKHLRDEGKQGSIPMDLHAQLQAASLVSMITWWLENDCPYTPAEMITHIYEHIDLAFLH